MLKTLLPSMTQTSLKRIHEILHNKSLYPSFSKVLIVGKEVPIQVSSTGCRFIIIGDVKYIQQCSNTKSYYAALVKKNYKVTWGIRPYKPWLVCIQAPDGVYEQVTTFD